MFLVTLVTHRNMLRCCSVMLSIRADLFQFIYALLLHFDESFSRRVMFHLDQQSWSCGHSTLRVTTTTPQQAQHEHQRGDKDKSSVLMRRGNIHLRVLPRRLVFVLTKKFLLLRKVIRIGEEPLAVQSTQESQLDFEPLLSNISVI